MIEESEVVAMNIARAEEAVRVVEGEVARRRWMDVVMGG